MSRDSQKSIESNRRWRARPENKEKVRLWHGRPEVRERRRLTNKRWYDSHRTYALEISKDFQHRQRIEDPIKVMLYDAKKRAKKKNLPFDIVGKDIERVTHCPVFGVELDYLPAPKKCGIKPLPPANRASLDRLVPELGYVKENVIIVSWRANKLRNDASPTELKLLAEFYCKRAPTE